MNLGNSLDYYLALLQLHIAVVGLVIAGVVALVQLLNNAKPHRDIRLLVRPLTLVTYGSLLVSLLLLLALGSWVSAFPAQAYDIFGSGVVDFFSSGFVGLAVVTLMLVSLVWFVQLAFKARALLDSQQYLRTYIDRLPARVVHSYLEAAYSDKPSDRVLTDPFQPVREYLKDNAFRYYDYGTADGLRQFGVLFDKALAASRGSGKKVDEMEFTRLARFVGENCEEFFKVFTKTASEKRKSDTITLLYNKGLALLHGGHDASHASLLFIVRSLEEIAKMSDDDDEIIAAIGRIRQLCDAFLEGHKKQTWDHISEVFDEICLSVTRISEDYYLQKNNSLKTVPIVGYVTGMHHTVTTALVDFFGAYRDLGDRFTDTEPRMYFEAIESVIEVLFVRLGDIVENGQQDVGYTATYHNVARQLYDIYDSFGTDAIEHKKPELLGMVLSNLRRIIKPAKNFRLVDERQELCVIFVRLAVGGVAVFGDIAIKADGRKISEYTLETLSKHITKAQVSAALKTLDIASIAEQKSDIKPILKELKAFAA